MVAASRDAQKFLPADDADDAVGRMSPTCTDENESLPCVQKCKNRLKKCMLPWEKKKCGKTSTEECLARYVCCIDDYCCKEPECTGGCIGEDESCPDEATNCDCCDPLTCSSTALTPGTCVCPSTCTGEGSCSNEVDCCCAGYSCSYSGTDPECVQNPCSSGSCSCETGFAWDQNQAMMNQSPAPCFTIKSWGWAVPFEGTELQLTIYQAAGNGCMNAPATGKVGTGTISADGLTVTLTPDTGYTFAEIHIDVSCDQPLERGGLGQYNNGGGGLPSCEPTINDPDCIYPIDSTLGDACTVSPVWFRIHVVPCGPP